MVGFKPIIKFVLCYLRHTYKYQIRITQIIKPKQCCIAVEASTTRAWRDLHVADVRRTRMQQDNNSAHNSIGAPVAYLLNY